MTLGARLLRLIYPSHEAQRRELRKLVLQTEACAEDIVRTVRTRKPMTVDQLTHPKK